MSNENLEKIAILFYPLIQHIMNQSENLVLREKMDGMFKKSNLVLLSHNTLRNIKERKIILCKYGQVGNCPKTKQQMFA